MHPHDAGVDTGVPAPDVRDELLCRDDTAGLLHQHFGDLKLLAAECPRFASVLQLVGGAIQRRAAAHQQVGREVVLAAYHRPDAGKQLCSRERLGKIIVRSRVKTLHALRNLCPCRKEQSRRGNAFASKPLQHFNTVRPGAS